MIKINVCISTLNREFFLSELLSSIFKINLKPEFSVKVIVVDNDFGKSSESVVVKFKEIPSQFSLVDAVQPIRGIPQSRNLAFSIADHDSDFVIFIDDDEVVDKNWLITLLDIQAISKADVVSGPVFPKFLDKCPNWIVKGKYFIRSDYDSLVNGESISYKIVKTNNVLIRYDFLSNFDGPFNLSMALTGGSDSELAYRMHLAGANIVWASEAIVWEFIPKKRASLRWILQRAYRTANTSYTLSPQKGLKVRFRLIIFGFIRLLMGLIFLPVTLIGSLFLGWHLFVNNLRIIVRGLGFITSGFNIKYEEYKSYN